MNATQSIVASGRTSGVVSTDKSDTSTPAADDRASRSPFRKFLYENGLTLVLMAMFLGTMLGQTITGWRVHNDEQREHGQGDLSLGQYLTSGHFLEATAENWESEFLQMAMFVLLTVCLRQKGSPESKSLEGEEDVDQDPAEKRSDPRAPWPVRRGGIVLWIYSHSLSIAFAVLFLVSLAVHAVGGAKEYSQEQQAHGEAAVTVGQFVGTSEFWFQSFQNWQSEFLSLAAMVYLAVYLREKGSAESKPVATPHDEQGE